MRPAPAVPGTLRFAFKKIGDELDTLARIAKPFLAQGADGRIAQFRNDLLEHQRQGSRREVWSWTIHHALPIQTRASQGEFEPANRGSSRHVYASIDGKWEIRTVNPKKKSQDSKEFDLVGGASVRVGLYETKELLKPGIVRGAADPLLGLWRMELGDHQSPGCHVHAQILGQDDAHPFPKWLPVPRLPSLFVTPAAAIEFVLGELFQDAWVKHMQERGPLLAQWANLQRPMLKDLLKWQLQCVNDESMFSPWTTLKRAKPPAGLFVETS